MFKEIAYNIKKEESFFFLFGWLSIAFFSIMGNTSLGMLLLLIHTGYTLLKKKRIPCLYTEKIYLIVGSFLLWGFISSFFAYNKSIAFISTFGYFLMLYLVFWGARKLVNYKLFFSQILLPVFIAGSTISSIYTLYNYFINNLSRSETFFVNKNGTGTLLAFSIIILIGYFEHLRSSKRYLLIIPILLSIGALLVTYSRGALVGFIAGFSIYNFRSKSNLLIFLVIILIISSLIAFSPRLKDRFLSIFSIKENRDRILIWEATIQMIKDHPIFGVGPGNYSMVYPDYRSPEAYHKNHPFSHNIFSNTATEMGIIGLFLYTYIIYKFIIMGASIININSLYRALWAGLIGILIHQQFDCTILGLEIGGLFWLTTGIITALYYKHTKTHKTA